jgi:hypothetical protein
MSLELFGAQQSPDQRTMWKSLAACVRNSTFLQGSDAAANMVAKEGRSANVQDQWEPHMIQEIICRMNGPAEKFEGLPDCEERPLRKSMFFVILYGCCRQDELCV